MKEYDMRPLLSFVVCFFIDPQSINRTEFGLLSIFPFEILSGVCFACYFTKLVPRSLGATPRSRRRWPFNPWHRQQSVCVWIRGTELNCSAPIDFDKINMLRKKSIRKSDI